MFKLTSFWCLYCWLWAYFTPFSSVSIVDFEQMLAGSLPLLERESDKIFIFEKTQYRPCPLFEGENRNNQVTGVDDKQTENFREKLA